MGTRGVFGFVIDGTEKIAYNHFDSYPEELGITMLRWIKTANTTEVRDSVRTLRLVTNDTEPTPEDVEQLKPFADTAVSTGSLDDWYVLLRETQGDPSLTLDAGVMLDSADFAQDSLFCEWGYVVDFDRDTFEVYRGFQTELHTDGRFAYRKPADPQCQPIRRIAAYPLGWLPSETIFLSDTEA